MFLRVPLLSHSGTRFRFRVQLCAAGMALAARCAEAQALGERNVGAEGRFTFNLMLCWVLVAKTCSRALPAISCPGPPQSLHFHKPIDIKSFLCIELVLNPLPSGERPALKGMGPRKRGSWRTGRGATAAAWRHLADCPQAIA